MGDAKQFPQRGDRLQIQQGQQEAIRIQWVVGLLIVLMLGVYFRWANLGDKVYWVDEVATSIRIAGTTKAQLTQALATGQILTAQQLLNVQQLDPALPWSATFAALRHSPEHAPLYFLLARLWLQLWGNGIAQIRSLSVLFSLLSLPALFWLSGELFRSRRTSLIAVVLFSISPFFVAYAQEARPYSLWSLSLLLIGASLLRAIRTANRRNWLLYALCAAIGLYTSVLTLLVLVGQSLYIVFTPLGHYEANIARQHQRLLQQWSLAASEAVLLFLPWMIVIVQHWAMLQDNTTWARMPLSAIAMVAIWLYSIVVLFFDLPVTVSLSLGTIAKAFTALFILAIIGVSLASLRRSPKAISLFLLTFALPIPIVLMLIDLISHGQASATPRYLLPLQLAVLLVISRWFSDSPKKLPGKNLRRLKLAAFVLLIGFSLMSCLSNLNRIPDYLKAHNRFNSPIAAIINQSNRPLILSEAANTMNLLSLSHSLLPAIPLQIFPEINLEIALNACNTNFLFNPSSDLVDRLRQSASFTLQQTYQPNLLTPDDIHLSLWRIQDRKTQDGKIQNDSLCERETAQ